MAASKKQPAKGRKTTAKKTTASKPRTVTKAKAAPKAAETPAPRQRKPKEGPKTIRNLLSVPQHFRLQGSREKPYRIELKPRGVRGDTAGIPLDCQSDTAFISGLDRTFEIITDAELRDLAGQYPPVGYQGRQPLMPMADGSLVEQNVRVVRQQQNVVAKTVDPYAEKANAQASPAAQQALLAQQAAQQGRTGGVGPHVANMPGSDHGMTAGMGGMGAASQQSTNAAAVQNATRKPVSVQRTRG